MKLKICAAVVLTLTIVAEQCLAQIGCVRTLNYVRTYAELERLLNAYADLEQPIKLLRQWRNDTEICDATLPTDCLQYLSLGFNTSGVYTLRLDVPAAMTATFQDPSFINVQVYCDMETAGGGWTVFQRRVSASVSFERNWHDYKAGFGSLVGNLWWGNDNLALALNDGRRYDLRIDMTDWDDEYRYATYRDFRVADESDNYRLNLGIYAGDAGNALGGANGKQFSTADRDNDGYGLNCASRHRGASWFGTYCALAFPNGPYSDTRNVTSGRGVIWKLWHGIRYSLKRFDMKFRVIN